ncbi:MAG: hypothetical protein WBE94_21990 [Pseudolabrys sp.]
MSQFHFDLGVYYLNARHLILSYLMPVGWFFKASLFLRRRVVGHTRGLFFYRWTVERLSNSAKNSSPTARLKAKPLPEPAMASVFNLVRPLASRQWVAAETAPELEPPGPDIPGGFGDPLGGLV